MRSLLFPSSIFISLGLLFSSHVCAQSNQEKISCSEKIQKQGEILLNINRKIVAIPPLVNIYSSTKDVWNQAISAKNSGDYKECNRLLDIGIKYSEAYAK